MCIRTRSGNGPSAYLIPWKRFVTLIPSISTFSAERKTVDATELKCSLSITRRATGASLLNINAYDLPKKIKKLSRYTCITELELLRKASIGEGF